MLNTAVASILSVDTSFDQSQAVSHYKHTAHWKFRIAIIDNIVF
jgi:hypothetical protein